jgi:hypothetical protein
LHEDLEELKRKFDEVSARLTEKDQELEELQSKFESSQTLLESADHMMTNLQQKAGKYEVYHFFHLLLIFFLNVSTH